MSDKNTLISSPGGVSANWLILANDADYLKLSGGTLTGLLTIERTGYPGIGLADASSGRKGHIEQSGDLFVLHNISPDGTKVNGTRIVLAPEATIISDMLMAGRTVDSKYTAYRIYGTHNITIGTTAPSATLSAGEVAMTY